MMSDTRLPPPQFDTHNSHIAPIDLDDNDTGDRVFGVMEPVVERITSAACRGLT